MAGAAALMPSVFVCWLRRTDAGLACVPTVDHAAPVDRCLGLWALSGGHATTLIKVSPVAARRPLVRIPCPIRAGAKQTVFTASPQPLVELVGGLFLAGDLRCERDPDRVARNPAKEAGLEGRRRGQEAAALDAAGAALGAFGMLAFAAVFWVLVGMEALRARHRRRIAVMKASCRRQFCPCGAILPRALGSMERLRDVELPEVTEDFRVTRRRGSGIHASAQRNCVELGVRRLLLVQVGVEEANHFVMPEFFGPGDQRAVAAHLVVLDGLRVATMAASSTALSSISPAVSSASLIKPSIAGQCGSAGLLAELLEHLLEPLDLLVGLFRCDFEARDQIAVGRLLDHLRQPLR